MILTSQSPSTFGETTTLDSGSRSGTFRIQSGLTTYGSLSGSDLKDYFQITPGIGSFALFVTTDTVNFSQTSQSQLNSAFDVKITDASGNVLLNSNPYTGAGDNFTRGISFFSPSFSTYYVEVSHTDAASFAYAATMTLDTTPPPAPKLVTNSAFNFLVNPQVTIQTTMGNVVVELNPEQAPITVANMLAYTNTGFYDGTLFHRVINGFMAQGGGFTGNSTALTTKSPTYAAIPLESNNGLTNVRGAIAMARTSAADSATSQFFINQVDNAFLNYSSSSAPGYAVFGNVLSGMDVIDNIVKVPTTTIPSAGFADVPVTNITITSVTETLPGSAITNSAVLTVSAIEANAQWSYTLDGGVNWLTGSGNTLTVPVGTYGANAIQVRQTDLAGNLSATTGKLGSALIVETTAPVVQSFSPADEATGIATSNNVVITFSEAIAKGAGSLMLKTADGTIVESFNVATSTRLTISGNTLTVDPTADLAPGKAYKLEIAAGAIQDLAGNAYAGTTSYNFTTQPPANTLPTGEITILGTPTQGQLLAVGSTLADPDGLGTFSYQWKAAGVAISGATGSTFTPTQAQVGKALSVTVTYTDGFGTVESVTSAASSPVANVNDAPTAGSLGNRTAGVNEAVSIGLAMLFSDVDGDSLSYSATGLPAGIAINSATGVVSGTSPATTGVHHVTVTATDPGSLTASLAFDLVVMNGSSVNASVIMRNGSPLPGVTAHEVYSVTPVGSLFAFKNFSVDSGAGGSKTLSADLLTSASGDSSIALTLHATSGAGAPGLNLNGAINTTNGWSIVPNTSVTDTYGLSATQASAPVAASTVIGKITLPMPATASDTLVLDLANANLGAQNSADRALRYSKTDLGVLGQLNITLPDSNLGVSLERATTDLIVAGKKPITAADALDALKLSVGLAGSTGSSWKELIAADMNHDGRVTAADALEILKASVGTNSIQPSWVFVPNDTAVNPNLGSMSRTAVTFKDDFNLSAITGATSATITGILVGDVNNSWVIPT